MGKNELKAFEEKHLLAFQTLQALEKQKKEIEKQSDELRAYLTRKMEESNITGIDNDYVRITYIPPSESVSLDTKKLRAEKPDVYGELLHDYSKVTSRRGYTRITAK